MGTNSIAKASLLLTTDSGGVDQGLSATDTKLQNWAKKNEKKTEKTGKGLGSKLQEGMEKAGEGKGGKEGKEGGKATWLDRLSSVGNVFTGLQSAGKLVADIFASFSTNIEKTTKAARELGVGVEGFSALQYAAKIAGVSTEDLGGAITALEENLQKADGPAARLFDQLGLSVTELRELPVDQATAKIADALKGIQDPVERARLSLAVFGDKAVQLGPLLDKGGEGITALTDKARATGIAFNSVQAEKVKAAREAIAQLGARWEGFTNTLAISTAGFVEWGAKALGSLGSVLPSMDQVGKAANDYLLQPLMSVAATYVDYVSNMTEMYLSWGSAIADTVGPYITGTLEAINSALDALSEAWSSTWEAMTGWATDAADSIYEGVSGALSYIGVDLDSVYSTLQDWWGKVKQGFSQLWDYVKSFWSYIFKRSSGGDAIRSAADSIANSIEAKGKAEDAGKAIGEAIAKGAEKVNPLNNVKAKVLQGINSLEEEIRKNIQTIGMTGFESKVVELENQGASPDQLKNVKELAKQAKNVEAAWSTIELPPAEMFQRQIDGLDKMLEDGRINWQQYAQGVSKAGKQLTDAAGLGPQKTVGAAVEGSSAAVSAIIKAQLQDQVQNDPAAEIKRAQKELKAIQEGQWATSKEILGAIKDKEEIGVI